MAAFQVDDVMEGSGILKAQLAGHALKRSNEMGNCQESRNDPLTLLITLWKGVERLYE